MVVEKFEGRMLLDIKDLEFEFRQLWTYAYQLYRTCEKGIEKRLWKTHEKNTIIKVFCGLNPSVRSLFKSTLSQILFDGRCLMSGKIHLLLSLIVRGHSTGWVSYCYHQMTLFRWHNDADSFKYHLCKAQGLSTSSFSHRQNHWRQSLRDHVSKRI